MTEIISVFAALTVIYLIKGIVIVRQGHEYTVEQLGRYIRTLRPGYNWIWPIFQKVGVRINKMEQVLDVPTQEIGRAHV